MLHILDRSPRKCAMPSCEERGTDLPALPARKAPQLAYHAHLKFLRILKGVGSHLHFGPLPGPFSVMQKEGHCERGVDGTDTAGNRGLQGKATRTKGGPVRGDLQTDFFTSLESLFPIPSPTRIWTARGSCGNCKQSPQTFLSKG